jgi:hypothetical protein
VGVVEGAFVGEGINAKVGGTVAVRFGIVVSFAVEQATRKIEILKRSAFFITKVETNTYFEKISAQPPNYSVSRKFSMLIACS